MILSLRNSLGRSVLPAILASLTACADLLQSEVSGIAI